MYYVRYLKKPKKTDAPPLRHFSRCGGCVTLKKCKDEEVCDAETLFQSAKGQKNGSAKKVSGGVKKSNSRRKRNEAHSQAV